MINRRGFIGRVGALVAALGVAPRLFAAGTKATTPTLVDEHVAYQRMLNSEYSVVNAATFYIEEPLYVRGNTLLTNSAITCGKNGRVIAENGGAVLSCLIRSVQGHIGGPLLEARDEKSAERVAHNLIMYHSAANANYEAIP
ncbi:MAG: hypothetical protein JWL61_4983 [Gemmatimonadetes bacterium]|nr:hypothetical protein [Gemmatimonadota bacterium]